VQSENVGVLCIVACDNEIKSQLKASLAAALSFFLNFEDPSVNFIVNVGWAVR